MDCGVGRGSGEGQADPNPRIGNKLRASTCKL